MTDITPAFTAILKSQAPQSSSPPQFSVEKLNDFLKEAYQINSRTAELLNYLRKIRKPYLSTAPPPRKRLHASIASISSSSKDDTSSTLHLTDPDRDAIDANSKTVLRDIHAAINQLRSAESIRQEAERALVSKRRWQGAAGGFLGRWAAGSSGDDRSLEEKQEDIARDTVKIHRESVIWFLERGLESCGRFHGGMVEIRVKREIEKGKSMLYKASAGSGVPKVALESLSDVNGGASKKSAFNSKGLPPATSYQNDTQLDEAQMQLLVVENEDLMKHYENKLEQVRSTERSLLEISELHNTLSISLSTQSAQIDQLMADSLATEENVSGGNRELKKASERKSTAKAVFWASVGMCGFFVVWDLII